MIVCHLLLGRPWQYDHSSLHCGRSNQYTIKRKGKEMVLKPMTPQQIHAKNLQKSSEVKVQSEEEKEKKKMISLHKSISESHKQNMREKKKGEGDNLVMIATKSKRRDVRNNPNQIFIVLA
jgi:hypothetical protein